MLPTCFFQLKRRSTPLRKPCPPWTEVHGYRQSSLCEVEAFLLKRVKAEYSNY